MQHWGLKDSDMRLSLLLNLTGDIGSDRDMRHGDFLKSTCDMGPPSRVPGNLLPLQGKCPHRYTRDLILGRRCTQN